MNWDQVKGKWTEMQGKARQQWGELTDDDLAEAKGNREELAGKLQQRYGKTKEDARREVDDWVASL
ncbi:CsbD family protein [Stappia sp.]|uniref:CsbD family protein n=1 Tax=Stappia sp. TaxID=1870903 RepID=UPI0032D93E6B